jgi:hypothetical protein
MVSHRSGLHGSGVVREILAPTVFIFDNYTGVVTVVVAEHVDIGSRMEACFVTRFHSGTIAGTGTISVFFKVQGWTVEDPTNPFIPNVGGATVAPAATAGGLINPQPPLLVLSTAIKGTGPSAAIVIAGTANGACNATISIDLIAKGGTSVGNGEDYNSFLGFAG